MKTIIVLLLALVAFDTLGSSQARKEFKTRARASVKADDGKLMSIPLTAIACPSREKGIQIHNYLLKNYNGNYTQRILTRIVDNPCRMIEHHSAGFITERVAGSSFVKVEYTNTPTTIIERWFYLPALKTWREHRKNKLK